MYGHEKMGNLNYYFQRAVDDGLNVNSGKVLRKLGVWAGISTVLVVTPHYVFEHTSAEQDATLGQAQTAALESEEGSVRHAFMEMQQARLDWASLQQKTLSGIPVSKDAFEAAKNKAEEIAAVAQERAEKFEDRLLLSQAISEDDAVRFAEAYIKYNPNGFSRYSLFGDMNEYMSHLDECQNKSLPNSEEPEKRVASCMHDEDRSTIDKMAVTYTAGGLSLFILFFITQIAGIEGFERVRTETRLRQSRNMQKKKDKEAGVRDVTQRIKIRYEP